MSVAPTPSKNYAIKETDRSLTLTFPNEHDWFVVFLVLVWAGFLVYYVLPILGNAVQFALNPMVWNLMLVNAWLVLLVACFLVALLVLRIVLVLWDWAGREVVEVMADRITIHHDLLRWRHTKTFDAGSINGVYVSRLERNFIMRAIHRRRIDIGFFSFTHGKIAFNSGRTLLGDVRTYRFGTILNSDEANRIVSLILKKFPHYKYDSRYLP